MGHEKMEEKLETARLLGIVEGLQEGPNPQSSIPYEQPASMLNMMCCLLLCISTFSVHWLIPLIHT